VIDDAMAFPAEAIPAGQRRWRHFGPAAVGALAAGVALAAFGVWALLRHQQPGPSQQTARLAIMLPPAYRMLIPENRRDFNVSPDGRYIAFCFGGNTSGGHLAVRALDRMEVKVLSSIPEARSPFFSPDSRWIGFFEGPDLKKVSVNGGAAIVIGRNVNGYSASWADDNTIVFDSGRGLLSLPASGGAPTLLASPQAGEGEYVLPSVLPGHRGVLFTIRQRSPWLGGEARRLAADSENVQVAVLDFATGRHKTLIHGGTAAEYSRSGHLLYAITRTLFAARFDLDRLEMLGDPVTVVQDLLMATSAGAASYAVSREGTLVYVPGASRLLSLVWVDRNGVETPIPAPPRAYGYVKLSPDGAKAALEVREEDQDIFVWDFQQQALVRVTFDPALDTIPAWTPDGRWIVFGSNRNGVSNLYAQAADGTGDTLRLTTSDTAQFVNSITPDGRYALGAQWSPKTSYDIFLFPISGLMRRADAVSAAQANSSTQLLLQTPGTDFAAMISPDGHYFAYQSYESGMPEIYVRPFPRANEGRWQVSIDGGTGPIWARSGKELFYLNRERTLMSVAVQPAITNFRAGTPTKLLEANYATPGDFGSYDVAPDGKFLMMKEAGSTAPDASPASMVVVLNWFEELRAQSAAVK
jgi:eukaryotic-like serine/threonine-protein kinase